MIDTQLYIPVRDGIHLAATVYSSEQLNYTPPSSVLFSFHPYRKDDYYKSSDESFSAPFVAEGFIIVRVDIRGTGGTQGAIVPHEYSEQEMQDAEDIIGWITTQSWSNGSIGMYGMSWSAINSLMIATKQIPVLKAILVVHGSDDLFRNDIHYIDGILHYDSYSLSMEAFNCLPQSPDMKIDAEYFHDRFDQKPWSFTYLSQQRESDFYKSKSVKYKYDSMDIPVFVIGGLYDGYRDTVLNLFTCLKNSVVAMLGPWNHCYPHDAGIGAIDWFPLAIDFFRKYLLPTASSPPVEKFFYVYVRDYHPPGTTVAEVPGKWFKMTEFHTQPKELYLHPTGRLSFIPYDSLEITQVTTKTVLSDNLALGFWWGELMQDQNEGEQTGFLFSTDPLQQDICIVGQPTLRFRASSNVENTNWFLLLEDVAPDGKSTHVTGCSLNSNHLLSAEEPRHLTPGGVYDFLLTLHLTTWTFQIGHRIRLRLLNSLFPMMFSTYHPETETALHFDEAPVLKLPIFKGDHAGPVFFDIMEMKETVSSEPSTQIIRDNKENTERVIWRLREEIANLTLEDEMIHTLERTLYMVQSMNGTSTITLITPDDKKLVIVAKVYLKATSQDLALAVIRRLYENGKLRRTVSFQETFPRDYQ